MADPVLIAVDAMGGDEGPPVVVAGADLARERSGNIAFVFFGDSAAIEAELARYPKLQPCARIVHTDDVVLATDKPGHALRHGRKTSMAQAINAVKAGECAAAVSAGNTGALMAMAKFILRTSAGIDRPALVSLMPTLRAESVMLDLGANTEC